MSGFVTLQGSLLVAMPVLADPNFHRTVVLVAEHGPEAAMGLVLNRPLPVAASEAVPILADVLDDDAPLFAGGPVGPQSVTALAEFSDPGQAASIAFGAIGFVRADQPSEDVEAAVRRLRVFAGYAGWGPGQLEAELEQEAWTVASAVVADVFCPDASRLWADVLDRLGGAFRLLARMPFDPSWN